MTSLDYDHLATEYARHRRTYPGLVEHLVGRSGVGADSTVLEIGCGTANHLAGIARATGARCLGVDPSAEMLRQAATHPEELDLRQGTAEEFDVPAGSVDLIMSVDVIHYVRRPRLFFDRAFAALRPGGLIVTVTDSDWIIRHRRPLAHYFPATVAAEATRYHQVPALAGDLALVGFGELSERVIESDYELTDASRFRDKSYSCLHLISDDEFAAGIATLEADLARGPIRANLRSLALWGRRPA